MGGAASSSRAFPRLRFATSQEKACLLDINTFLDISCFVLAFRQ